MSTQIVSFNSVSERESLPPLSLLIRQMLAHLDKDPEREGLCETPQRVARFYSEWISREEPDFKVTTFCAEDYEEIVIVRDIPFFSLCEHHLIPFFGHASVGYIPSSSIVGLSKLPRVVKYFSAMLQNQERLTQQIATFLQQRLNPQGVAVTVSARHLCTEMRGVCSVGNSTITTCFLGELKTSHERRLEYFRLIESLRC